MELICSGLGSGLRCAQIRPSDVFSRKNSFGKVTSSNGIKTRKESSFLLKWKRIRAAVETGADEKQGSPERQRSFNSHVMEVSPTFNNDADFKVWDSMSALVRLTYGVGLYGVMALAGKAICCFTGVNDLGGLDLCTEAVLNGLGYAVPPMMSLLFIMDDEVVKLSPYARAIRDVEDEELVNFFLGMSPWQFLLIVTASSVGEELFYRVAVQGGLAHVFLSDTWQSKDAYGIATLTGIFPFFVPFAQAFAAVLTAALTGSLYYVAASPRDPTYVVAQVPCSTGAREDMKKCFSAWYERREMKKIYSPLLESILALYLGFEWIQTDNILAPMITHAIYSGVVLGHGLWRIHDQRQKLRKRIKSVWQKEDLGTKLKP